MGKFKGEDKFGGHGRDRGGRSNRQMHHAVCSDCGRDCEVPFRPTGDKPVYCSECFGNKNGGGDRFERRSNNRSSFQDKLTFDAICDECGVECELPFKPSSDKPVYCSACFEIKGRNNRGGTGGGDISSKQFEMLNYKLDNIIKMIASTHSVTSTSSAQVKKEEPVTKKEKKEKKTTTKKAVVKKKVPVKKVPAKKTAPKKKVTTKKASAKKKK